MPRLTVSDAKTQRVARRRKQKQGSCSKMLDDPFLNWFALGLFVFVLVAVFYGIIAIHDISARIAESRHHPHKDAIHAAGWVSLFTLHVLWPFFWIWAMAYQPQRGWGFSKPDAAPPKGPNSPHRRSGGRSWRGYDARPQVPHPVPVLQRPAEGRRLQSQRRAARRSAEQGSLMKWAQVALSSSQAGALPSRPAHIAVRV